PDHVALVFEAFGRDPPAAIQRPEQIRDRDPDLVEEDLAELVHRLRCPRYGADLHARRVQVEDEAGDPGVAGRVRIRPGVKRGPAGLVRLRRPDLGAVHDELVAVAPRPRSHGREVRPGTGL